MHLKKSKLINSFNIINSLLKIINEYEIEQKKIINIIHFVMMKLYPLNKKMNYI